MVFPNNGIACWFPLILSRRANFMRPPVVNRNNETETRMLAPGSQRCFIPTFAREPFPIKQRNPGPGKLYFSEGDFLCARH